MSNSGPLSAPAGTPISRHIQVPDRPSFDAVRHALAAIDQVHGDGALPYLPVVLGPATMRAEAEYMWDARTGRAMRVAVKPGAASFSVIHEIGHFIDQQALSETGTFASASDQLPEVMAELERTNAIGVLRALWQRRHILVVGRRGRREVVVVDRGRVEYLLQPEEQFARAYAQFVAIKSRDAVAIDELERRRADPIAVRVYHQQWEEEDFAPVAAALELMLRRRGWTT